MWLSFLAIFWAIMPLIRGSCSKESAGLKLMVASEHECALNCRIRENCASYFFKDLAKFQSESNQFNTNCVLKNLYTENLGSAVTLMNDQPVNYESKTCLKLPSAQINDSFDVDICVSTSEISCWPGNYIF